MYIYMMMISVWGRRTDYSITVSALSSLWLTATKSVIFVQTVRRCLFVPTSRPTDKLKSPRNHTTWTFHDGNARSSRAENIVCENVSPDTEEASGKKLEAVNHIFQRSRLYPVAVFHVARITMAIQRDESTSVRQKWFPLQWR